MTEMAANSMQCPKCGVNLDCRPCDCFYEVQVLVLNAIPNLQNFHVIETPPEVRRVLDDHFWELLIPA